VKKIGIAKRARNVQETKRKVTAQEEMGLSDCQKSSTVLGLFQNCLSLKEDQDLNLPNVTNAHSMFKDANLLSHKQPVLFI